MNKKSVFLLFILSSFFPCHVVAFNQAVIPEASRQHAPDFLLEDLQGVKHKFSDYKGKVVLLNFWATWCVPCRKEMPSMEALWQKYKKKGFIIVAVSGDGLPKKRVKTFIRIFKLNFKVLLDQDREVSDLYKVSGMPTSFLIDRNGKIINRYIGSEDWLSVEFTKLLDKILVE